MENFYLNEKTMIIGFINLIDFDSKKIYILDSECRVKSDL